MISAGFRDIGSILGRGLWLQGGDQPAQLSHLPPGWVNSFPSKAGTWHDTLRNLALSPRCLALVPPPSRAPPALSQTCSTRLAAQHLPEVPLVPLFQGTPIPLVSGEAARVGWGRREGRLIPAEGVREIRLAAAGKLP